MAQQQAPPQEGPGGKIARFWQAGLITGVVTLILGVIVAFNPGGSLTVVAVLLGVLLLVSGIYHLVAMFDGEDQHRVFRGIAGLLFIVAGVVLIRHLDLTKAIIGLFIGLVWIVQGVVTIIAGTAGGTRQARGWWVAFGVISLIAGIVVAATPLTSLTALAVLLGIWFIVMGAFEIVGALILRRGLRSLGPPRA